jgi:hypothetical protein
MVGKDRESSFIEREYILWGVGESYGKRKIKGGTT